MQFYLFIFFFQAEDGIRDTSVTGVQTCALPILTSPSGADSAQTLSEASYHPYFMKTLDGDVTHALFEEGYRYEIGRASCRERVRVSEEAWALERKSNLLDSEQFYT